MNTIDIKNLSIEDEHGNQLITNVDFTIYDKQVNAIIGESGAGKTLLMRFILNQLPANFRVNCDQFHFNDQAHGAIQYQLGKDIGYISQNYTQSFNDHSKLGKQLVAIYRTHYDVTKQEAISIVNKALGWVNLEGEFILQRYSFQLSGGQLERVYIASVLMLDPKLIIADEPVASLDVVNGQQIMDLLQHIVKDHHQTLLIVTHNMSHVLKYADYINVMKFGQIIDYGDLNYFQSHHINPYSQQLLHSRSHLKRDEHD